MQEMRAFDRLRPDYRSLALRYSVGAEELLSLQYQGIPAVRVSIQIQNILKGLSNA